MKIYSGFFIVGVILLFGCRSTGELSASDDGGGGYECFLIENGDIRSHDLPDIRKEMTPSEHLAEASQGHEIVDGKFPVLSVRKFVSAGVQANRQSFMKLTIKLSGGITNEPQNEVAESYFTKGVERICRFGLLLQV